MSTWLTAVLLGDKNLITLVFFFKLQLAIQGNTDFLAASLHLRQEFKEVHKSPCEEGSTQGPQLASHQLNTNIGSVSSEKDEVTGNNTRGFAK